MKAWINILGSCFVKRRDCMKLLFKSKLCVAFIFLTPLLGDARAGAVPLWDGPRSPGELWNANELGLVSEVQSVLLFGLTSLLGLQPHPCGSQPSCLTRCCRVSYPWLFLLLPTPSPHRQKRLWQTSCWPLGAPQPQPRREPRPPKPSICRPRRAARARWGASCLAQYVQCCCCFTDCPACVQLCLWSVPGWVGSHLFISKSWARALCQACKAVLYHWPFVICSFGSLSPPGPPGYWW